MEKIKSTFIRKRNNKYYVYVEFEDEIGKRKQKSQGSFELRKDADRLLIEIKNDINKEVYSIPKAITFVERCYKYYDDKIRDMSPTTQQNGYSAIKNHIAPYFENTLLSDITISRYQDFINNLYANKGSDNSKKLIVAITKCVLNECYRLREINTKVTDFVKVPKRSKKEIEIFTIEEVKKIIDAVKYEEDYVKIVINMYAFCGMRFGEMAGLTWDLVDFENSKIHVRNNLLYVKIDGKFKHVMHKTKTESSNRIISAPSNVMSILKDEKIRQNKLRVQGLLKNNEWNVVCLNRDNNYIRVTTFRDKYKRLLKKLHIPYKKPHALRHSHVSMLLAQGVDIKTISARVGHSNTDMTLNTYAHVIANMDKKASDKIEELLL